MTKAVLLAGLHDQGTDFRGVYLRDKVFDPGCDILPSFVETLLPEEAGKDRAAQRLIGGNGCGSRTFMGEGRGSRTGDIDFHVGTIIGRR